LSTSLVHPLSPQISNSVKQFVANLEYAGGASVLVSRSTFHTVGVLSAFGSVANLGSVAKDSTLDFETNPSSLRILLLEIANQRRPKSSTRITAVMANPVATFIPLLFVVGIDVGVAVGVGYVTGDAEALFVTVNTRPMTPPLWSAIDGL
jgi:hypothetical protein